MALRDSQRSKVYAWERKAAAQGLLPLRRERLSLDACSLYVTAAWQDYGLAAPVPTVRDGRGHRRATWGGGIIQLPRWARTTEIVLHEVAHGVCEALARDDPPHGPAFVFIYVDLLERFAGGLAAPLVELADQHRVRVADRFEIRPAPGSLTLPRPS